MARKVTTTVLCDLDGNHPGKEVEAVDTIDYAVGGTGFEMDVCSPCADLTHATFDVLIRNSRRRGHQPRPSAGRRVRTNKPREIRDWAAAQGIIVSERGRVPEHVIQQYEAAH